MPYTAKTKRGHYKSICPNLQGVEHYLHLRMKPGLASFVDIVSSALRALGSLREPPQSHGGIFLKTGTLYV